MSESREKALLATYGEWGTRYRRYLIDHDKEKYYTLLSAGEFFNYITEINMKAEHLYDKTVRDLEAKKQITTELKKSDPNLWQNKMNAIEKQAEEFVLRMMILSEK
ncbi:MULTISPECIES: TnpV protein [Clostridia]|uniref:TnpV protein n=1 Tax=Ruminococcus difficilis TaxID=2763069 RepID=A0A934TZY4_9FIRM|nr:MULTISPECIES: TnpV protein [Clostridia]MBK6088695.1 TnpV protein [Ruminococcus difficilis]MBU5461806.1 TnpV protein [Lachnoclostridium sp. MSJ-17]